MTGPIPGSTDWFGVDGTCDGRVALSELCIGGRTPSLAAGMPRLGKELDVGGVAGGLPREPARSTFVLQVKGVSSLEDFVGVDGSGMCCGVRVLAFDQITL